MVVNLLGVSAVKESRWYLDYQDMILLRYLEDGEKESLDMGSVLSLGLERLWDEVSLGPT